MTKKAISAGWLGAKPEPGKYWDKRYSGLGVRVWSNRTQATWLFQKSGGKQQNLGRWPEVTVEQARLKAAELNAGNRIAPTTQTIEQIHEVWCADLIARGKSAATVETRTIQLHKHCCGWMTRDPATISPIELTAFRTALIAHSPYVAKDVANHIAALVRFSGRHDFRLRDLPLPSTTTRRHIDDIGAWWEAVQASNATDGMKAALAFAALTGLRQGEILAARRSRLHGSWLHIPEPKGGRAFDRHMPWQCLDIIARQPLGDLIFPFNAVRINSIPRTHACRHNFISVMEAELSAPRRVTRALVNHTGTREVTDRYGKTATHTQAVWSQKAADYIAAEMRL